MSFAASIGCLNRAMRCLNTNTLLNTKVNTIYKTQKILQLKDIYTFLKWTNSCTNMLTISYLLRLTNNYLKLITDVHSYNTRQIKTRRFALPKARSNSGAEMIKFSAIEIWSRIPSEIKNETCLALFSAEYKKYVLLDYDKHASCSYWLVHINHGVYFNYLTSLQRKLSNHEVSPLYTASFGFCCDHKNWSHQTSVWSNGMP